MAVDDKYRKRGIGKNLVDLLIKKAKSLKISFI